jgi:hypothetical protein
MMRRNFVAASAAAGLAGAARPETPAESYYRLDYYYLRQGPQVERATGYLSQTLVPALGRAGAGPVGLFSPVISDCGTFSLALVTYPSLAAIETVRRRLAEDKDFQKGWEDFNAVDPPYVRIESELLRAFDAPPALDGSAAGTQRPARIFELRTYQSPSEKALRRKIGMFEQGEAAIFRRVGMATVFFGEAVVGRNLPKLTYMLSYEGLPARDRLWGAFSNDPEWQKLRVQPGLSDAEIVSSVANQILRPLAASPIR